MKKSTTSLGRAAETAAEHFYLGQGYVLVERNFRSYSAEIDLILARGRELLVVEVKGRKRFREEEAWAGLWGKKKRKIRGALRWFLASRPEWRRGVSAIRLEIVFVVQGRVSERFEDEPFF